MADGQGDLYCDDTPENPRIRVGDDFDPGYMESGHAFTWKSNVRSWF